VTRDVNLGVFTRRAVNAAGGVGVYTNRVHYAAWAFGVNGMLPPSYTKRVGVNPDRHARTRLKHFTRALDRAMLRYFCWCIEDEFSLETLERLAQPVDGYRRSAGSCGWGCRY
jgi:hypothetical protein